MRQDFLQASADVVVAFLVANARATAALAAMPIDRIIQVGNAKWAGEYNDQVQWVDRILWRRRGWSWITEGDVRTLIVLSQVKSMFDAELKVPDVLRVLKPAAALARKAWIISGARPSLGAFIGQDAEDARVAALGFGSVEVVRGFGCCLHPRAGNYPGSNSSNRSSPGA